MMISLLGWGCRMCQSLILLSDLMLNNLRQYKLLLHKLRQRNLSRLKNLTIIFLAMMIFSLDLPTLIDWWRAEG